MSEPSKQGSLVWLIMTTYKQEAYVGEAV